jgi:hypothetical protein
MLLKRQDVLQDAWKAFGKLEVAEEKFADEWMKFRADKLTEADMPVVF